MSGEVFITAVRQRLSFLGKHGWRIVFEHVDRTAARAADVVVLRRDPLLMRLQRQSIDDVLEFTLGWIDLDAPESQQVYPQAPCTLNDLLAATGAFALSIESMRAADAVTEVARSLKTSLAPIVHGDDTLIATLSEQRAQAHAEERQRLRERSIHREWVQGIEILEVPAEPDRLGADDFRRFPDNEPDRGTWFIVATPLGDMVVYSLAAARETAQEFG
jgi:hypothetical protein